MIPARTLGKAEDHKSRFWIKSAKNLYNKENKDTPNLEVRENK